ncbi:MAG: hypothetical protein AB8H47_29710 [Bacteroidia bacterium]
MKSFLTASLLFFSLAGNAQLNLEWGTSISVGGSGYAPSLRVYQMGLSPQVGMFVEVPMLKWADLRLGAAFTLTQQKRPHFTNNFAYLGLPISMIVSGDLIGKEQGLKPIFMGRFHPAWLLGGPPSYSSTSPTSLVADYRGLWGAGLGFQIIGQKRQHEILFTASLSNPLNANYEASGTIEPLLGTRLALEWNLKL